MTAHERLRAAAWWVFALGISAAIAIHLFAPPASEDPLGDPTDSKKYLHDLEVYGGKANVLQDEFRRWFAGLWRGKELGTTVGALSVLAFVLLRFVAGPPQRAPELHLVRTGSPPGPPDAG